MNYVLPIVGAYLVINRIMIGGQATELRGRLGDGMRKAA